MDDAPRVLVEGGPVHRRVNHVLAAVIGLMIGVFPVLGFIGVRALEAGHDAHVAVMEVASSRKDSIKLSCNEANERHKTVKAGIEALAARMTPRQSQAVLEAFVSAIAPSYTAGTGTLADRERQGCEERVRKLTKP